MPSPRTSILMELYIFLRKMHFQTENMNHDMVFRNTILYLLEDNPSSCQDLACVYSCDAELVEDPISNLLDENMVKPVSQKENGEEVYELTYNGKKEIDKNAKMIEKYGTESISGLTDEEIQTLIKLVNKIVLEKQSDSPVSHDYFS